MVEEVLLDHKVFPDQKVSPSTVQSLTVFKCFYDFRLMRCQSLDKKGGFPQHALTPRLTRSPAKPKPTVTWLMYVFQYLAAVVNIRDVSLNLISSLL